jgi:hypothetical protein
MDKFNTICENLFPSTIKMVRRIHYPKQIQFSDKFVKALKTEFERLQSLEETDQELEVKPIKNYKEKFLKAINFCVNSF